MLRDLAAASSLRYIALRYFNVAGADPQGRSGQLGPTATPLVKISSQVVAGVRDSIAISGHDYDTPHRTCVRAYHTSTVQRRVGIECVRSGCYRWSPHN